VKRGKDYLATLPVELVTTIIKITLEEHTPGESAFVKALLAWRSIYRYLRAVVDSDSNSTLWSHIDFSWNQELVRLHMDHSRNASLHLLVGDAHSESEFETFADNFRSCLPRLQSLSVGTHDAIDFIRSKTVHAPMLKHLSFVVDAMRRFTPVMVSFQSLLSIQTFHSLVSMAIMHVEVVDVRGVNQYACSP
jgi:hypothetical protein